MKVSKVCDRGVWGVTNTRPSPSLFSENDLGSDSPQSNNRKDNSLWVTLFIPRERPNVKHAIAGYIKLPQPDTRRLQLPLDDFPFFEDNKV